MVVATTRLVLLLLIACCPMSHGCKDREQSPLPTARATEGNAAAPTTSISAQEPPPGWKRYTNHLTDFVLDYPDAWVFIEAYRGEGGTVVGEGVTIEVKGGQAGVSTRFGTV